MAKGKETLEQREYPNATQIAANMGQKPSKLYDSGKTAEVRQEAISAAVQQSRSLFKAAPSGYGVSVLHDTELVISQADVYLQACEMAGRIPSIMGLASLGLGISRQRIYHFMRAHPEHPTTLFLEKWTEACVTDLLADLSSRKYLDPATSIFLMKNQSGMSDKTQLELSPKEIHPLGEVPTQEEIMQQVSALPPPDDE